MPSPEQVAVNKRKSEGLPDKQASEGLFKQGSISYSTMKALGAGLGAAGAGLLGKTYKPPGAKKAKIEDTGEQMKEDAGPAPVAEDGTFVPTEGPMAGERVRMAPSIQVAMPSAAQVQQMNPHLPPGDPGPEIGIGPVTIGQQPQVQPTMPSAEEIQRMNPQLRRREPLEVAIGQPQFGRPQVQGIGAHNPALIQALAR